MHCPRCDGLMIAIRMKETMSSESVSGWRCLLCGETTDSGIEKNRQGHREPEPIRARLPGAPLLGSKRHLR